MRSRRVSKAASKRRSALMRFQDDGSVTNGIRVPYLKLARTLDTEGVRCSGRFVFVDSTTCGAERGKNQVQCALPDIKQIGPDTDLSVVNVAFVTRAFLQKGRREVVSHVHFLRRAHRNCALERRPAMHHGWCATCGFETRLIPPLRPRTGSWEVFPQGCPNIESPAIMGFSALIWMRDSTVPRGRHRASQAPVKFTLH